MTLVIAHRGASAAEPENTPAAFAAAVRMGADAVELDVRRSADGHVVVCHDPAYADGRHVHATVFADRPPGVCDLDEALDACGDLVVNVEIKHRATEPGEGPDEAIADDVVGVLGRRGAPDRYLVSSFDPGLLDRVRALAPDLTTGFLFAAGGTSTVLGLAVSRGHAAVHPHERLVDEDLVRAARESGLAVNVWTVDDPDRMRQLAALGVDGIVTNVPDLARRVLG